MRGAVVSPPSEYLWKTLTDHLNAEQPHIIANFANIGEISMVTIIDSGCTNYFAQNSGLTNPNLTKFS